MTHYAMHRKAEDRVELSAKKPLSDLHRLRGVWINTNDKTRGIAKVVLTPTEGRLMVHVFGICDPALCDWGKTEAEMLYADNITSHYASAFTAQYRFDFAEIQLQANWNQGLLVIGTFTTFTDSSERSNYFSREFFRQEGN
ncbi:MAG TPA: hypothetical protein VG649_08730 [Candidatus Angelobacter sp.]|nr:hypothetical protein [Candidatus Angelobacter sp.]